ncbi:MAG: hypothetical protein HZB13_11925 [Acidobacteria bacterium]|nr:hypothetical protein [Acidobacteriota bacterium]
MRIHVGCILAMLAISLWGSQAVNPAGDEQTQAGQRFYSIPAGTKIPLQLINSVSTKTAAVGDRLYLQTNFPILAEGRIVIPPGAYVTGTVTQVKRAGKVKGRAEIFVRFDALTLPNGVTRDFRASLGTMDGANPGKLDRTEGKVEGEGNKGGDATKVGEAAGWGTMIGGVAARSAKGAGIGAAAGAAAGLMGVLMTRGPDAILERGSSLEMVIDRTLKFTEAELAGVSPVNPSRPATTMPPLRPGSSGEARRLWPGN